MSEAEFNKNKPKNLARIVNDRVWSFELTDHTSGWIYAEYRFGGETAQNFTDVLINAMQERSGADVLHGVPAYPLYRPRLRAGLSHDAQPVQNPRYSTYRP